MIILDTHVLVWWIGQPDKLSKKAKYQLDIAISKNEILVSSISVWEIYLLVKRNRLKLTMDIDIWMERVEALPFLRFVPVDNKIAAKSVSLADPLHGDPADRIIIATSLVENALLVTGDKRILHYPHVQSLW